MPERFVNVVSDSYLFKPRGALRTCASAKLVSRTYLGDPYASNGSTFISFLDSNKLASMANLEKHSLAIVVFRG